MKNPIKGLHKEFENRIKLGIMTVLMVNDSLDFNEIKEVLEVTDGNLASHVAALENKKMIVITKKFIGKKPNTSYAATDKGRKAFAEHLAALEELLKNNP
ncbi:MAG: winged helix-turn-helix domain-containing protein [Owenweeksia sp.]